MADDGGRSRKQGLIVTATVNYHDSLFSGDFVNSLNSNEHISCARVDELGFNKGDADLEP
jgi:hypothetical protein